jgi:hypothetical protein
LLVERLQGRARFGSAKHLESNTGENCQKLIKSTLAFGSAKPTKKQIEQLQN